MDFPQKPLAWFSKFYLRVQSKNCGKNSLFLCFFSEFFSKFERKLFRLLVKKTSRSFKKLPSTCPEEQFVAWNNFFSSSFLNFSGFWAKNFSDFLPKNVKNLSKLPSTCPEEQFVAWNFFLKFWIVLDFLQKPSAWFSKLYLRVQSKNCGRNSFFCFSFQNFFRILSEIFSDFRPKNFKKMSKLPSACPEEQFVAWKIF